MAFGDNGWSPVCGDTVPIQAIVGLVALVVAFAGYRIYTVSIGLCGALTACAFIAAVGSAWYDFTELFGDNLTKPPDVAAMSDSDQPVKVGIIAFFCLVWSLMGALICVKVNTVIHKILGFVSGFALGRTAVVLLVLAASSQMHNVDQDTVDEYAGWQMYTIIAAGVPIASVVGYLTRNLIIYLLMAVTACLGSFIGVSLLAHALGCVATMQVSPLATLGVGTLSTVAAFLVQYNLTPETQKRSARTPETQKKSAGAPECVV